jgi:sirohydrochlorin ferrochelatase
LCEALAARRPGVRVELAFLPPAPPDIHEAVGRLVDAGIERIDVVAMLLSGGGRHMTRDIPEALAELRATYPSLSLTLVEEALGATDEVLAAMADAADRILPR